MDPAAPPSGNTVLSLASGNCAQAVAMDSQPTSNHPAVIL